MAETNANVPDVVPEAAQDHAKLCEYAKNRPEVVNSWLKQDDRLSSKIAQISANA